MSLAKSSTLGICISGQKVFYAVAPASAGATLLRIGQATFQFPILETVSVDSDAKTGVQTVLKRLVKDYGCSSVRLVTDSASEVWTTIPKSVYDEPAEREAYLAAYGEHIKRSEIEPFWFPLSNREFRMLVIRNRQRARFYEELVAPVPITEQISDFELGIRWALHSKTKGSYLLLHFVENKLVVSSFILGKLRGATTLSFLNEGDLPYLWLHNAQFLHWMRGIHDNVYVFGTDSTNRVNLLRPYIDSTVSIIFMDSPEKMHLEVEDKTYGFDLSEAWPATLAALEI